MRAAGASARVIFGPPDSNKQERMKNVAWLIALMAALTCPGEQLTRQVLEASSASSAELAKLLKSEIETYKTVFKTAGIKME